MQYSLGIMWDGNIQVCESHEVGISGSHLGGWLPQTLSTFGAGQLLTEQEYAVYARIFSISTHPISVPLPVEVNDSHCENKKFPPTFSKSTHCKAMSEIRTCLIFRVCLLKRSISEPIRNARAVYVN